MKMTDVPKPMAARPSSRPGAEVERANRAVPAAAASRKQGRILRGP